MFHEAQNNERNKKIKKNLDSNGRRARGEENAEDDFGDRLFRPFRSFDRVGVVDVAL